MTDINTLKTWLAQAEQAYHQLQIGAKTQELMMNGRRVIYTPADATKLLQYITQLKSDIARLESNSTVKRRPIYLGLK